MIVLAGDVGGTNARVATVEIAGTGARVLDDARFASQDYPGLAAILEEYLARGSPRPDRACFGVAGPVFGDEVKATNLPWTVKASEIGAAIRIPRTKIINDFVAVGYGIQLLGPEQLATIHAGQPVPRAPIATIGAGTGLGEGMLFWGDSHYHVHASEGGHRDFAPRDERQAGLAAALRDEFGRVSGERVISGPGLVNIYRYLAASGAAPEQPAIRAEMETDDPAAVVTRHALSGTDRLCQETLDLFIDAFGAEAGNLALTVVASGGVYLAGGIAPRIVELLRAERFMAAFRDKGRLSPLVAQMPVHVIMSTDVGLLGAAAEASRM